MLPPTVAGLRAKLPLLLAWLLLTLPWLNPFAPGPTPAVMPFLISWGCIALVTLVLLWAHQRAQQAAMLHAVVLAWVTAACLSALIGLAQYFDATAWAGVWLNHTEPGQAFGNLRQRNQFATLLNIGLAALLWYAARRAPTTATPKLQRPTWLAAATHAALLLAAALLAAGNAASASRTGLLQLGLMTLLAWFWQRQPKHTGPARLRFTLVQQVLLCALLSYAAASLVLPLLAGLDPLGSGAWARLRAGDAACSSRLTLWGNVLHLISLKPWLGWGWGELDYAHFITLYPGTRFCDILDNAHNLPLHLAVELGLPVALLVCTAVATLVWRAKPWREPDASRQLAWVVLAVVGLHSLLEYPLWYGPFQMATLLALWLLRPAQARWSVPQTYKHFRSIALYLSGFIAIFIIALMAYAAWHYQLASQIYLPPEARLAAYREDTQTKTRHVAWFQDQVRFADLTTTDLTPANAAAVHALALDMLHFSPETQVIERVLDSASLLGKHEEVAYFSLRYQEAFPADYARWVAAADANKVAVPLQ